jgi:5'-3' exoribonuclease 2
MGVPAFFRWLSEKYPKIITDVLDDRVHLAHNSGSIRQPFDSTRPNPSGIECDNFYIDMNGIIHPCSHPEIGPQPKTEEEMYENVCRYVDRLFRTVRPRKLLYLAIDGVAPRAKMNQQRSRRFRSAQEAREKKDLENELKDGLIKAGHQFESTKDPWDSNVITPGTKFMINLSEYLRFYIRKRISTDKAWKNVTVIFSDASIPGEGEHKIMAHIRHQRNQPSYNPNLVHVLHGLDADLIMLALATHEAHFYILREEVVFGRKGSEQSERRKEESGFALAQKQLDEATGAEAMQLPENQAKPLQRISIPILREYLAFEFQECNSVPFREISFERLLDDIVFLCFFVGK